MTGIEQGTNIVYWLYFLVSFIFGTGYSVFVAFYARKNGLLSKDPRETVWAVILGCGFVVVVYGLMRGLKPAAEIFGLFFASGMPTVLEHFYTSYKLKVTEAKAAILRDVLS